MPPPRIASDEWMAEQQLRAELEAEAWRRMREAAARPPELAPMPPSPLPPRDPSLGGSLILKALVRFALASAAGYLAYIAVLDAHLAVFDAWLAVGAAFITSLALSLLAPFRRVVHAMAETARWALIAAIGVGAVWLMLNPGAL